MTNKIPPAGATCEEASTASHMTYIPCGRPATAVVYFESHKEGPYNMCAMCADHNTRNRGATYVQEDAQTGSLDQGAPNQFDPTKRGFTP